MYDALLFFHLLFAAVLFVGMVTISAQVMGAPLQVGAMKASEALWGIGLIGTLVLGSGCRSTSTITTPGTPGS